MMSRMMCAGEFGGMCGWLAAAMLTMILSWPSTAQAQDQVFVQIESNTTLATTESRARTYAQLLPDVNAFRARTGLYAIALGPYSAADAPAVLRDLLARGLVPRDSFIVDGAPYTAQVFPIGAAALAAAQPAVTNDTPPQTQAAAPQIIAAAP